MASLIHQKTDMPAYAVEVDQQGSDQSTLQARGRSWFPWHLRIHEAYRKTSVPVSGFSSPAELGIVYRSGMTRQELVQAVLRGLPPAADAVMSPDHPLLMHGPDVIVAVQGTLTAYFISLRGAREIAASLPRVMLSRLAFPQGASCVLVLGEPVTLTNDLSAFFEEVVVLAGDRQPIIPTATAATSAGAEAAESMRVLHHERFADAWTATTRRRGLRRRRLPGEPTSLYVSQAPRLPTRYMDFNHGEFFFVPPQTATPGRMRTWLSRAIDLAVFSDYGLEAGIDGLSAVSRIAVSGDAHLARHYSKMASFPEVRRSFDSLKPFRAAAFAGYVTKLGEEHVI